LHAINYEAPKTLKDAVALLAQHGEKGRPLCGGTDLIIQLRAGVRRPDYIVDVKKISELTHLSYDAKKGLRLGAAVPAIEVCENKDLKRHYPGLVEAARKAVARNQFANPEIVSSSLGPDAQLHGAIWLAIQIAEQRGFHRAPAIRTRRRRGMKSAIA